MLSLKPRLLYTYFKQLFAQVTNPPIDPIREKLVMSLHTVLGWRRNLLSETPEHCRQVMLESPVLLDDELEKLKALGGEFPATTVSCLWPVSEGAAGLEKAIHRICKEAEAAVDSDARLIIFSDRGVDHQNVSTPMLLVVGAVHHYLRREGKRMKASIICETAEARDVHQIACLIGYGASCVNPYLAFETLRELRDNGKVEGDFGKAAINYKKALENGLLKIMSKMGISVVSSYRGSQVFEAIGISTKLVEECFFGTTAQIEGLNFRRDRRGKPRAPRHGLLPAPCRWKPASWTIPVITGSVAVANSTPSPRRSSRTSTPTWASRVPTRRASPRITKSMSMRS